MSQLANQIELNFWNFDNPSRKNRQIRSPDGLSGKKNSHHRKIQNATTNNHPEPLQTLNTKDTVDWCNNTGQGVRDDYGETSFEQAVTKRFRHYYVLMGFGKTVSWWTVT
jgi:hypothetical protein